MEYKNLIHVTSIDIGRDEKLREVWKCYFDGTTHFIIVIDSNDSEKMEEVKFELSLILNCDEDQGIPILLMANKQDLPNSLNVEQLTECLNLYSLLDSKNWNVIPCFSLSGDGILESMEWITCGYLPNEKRFKTVKSAKSIDS